MKHFHKAKTIIDTKMDLINTIMALGFWRTSSALTRRRITASTGGGGELGDPFTMPIGIRNYGDATTGANSVVQFGLPISRLREIDPGSLQITMTRDSDDTVIPVQLDLTSTTRLGGHLCYGVVSAKIPFTIAATTTVDCSVTITPGGTYSGGSEAVSLSQMNARDFKIEVVGDDISGTGVVGINSTDCVYYRKIMSGAVRTGWEGYSRVKSGGVAQGKWGVRWRIMGSGDTSLDDWILEAVVYCSDVETTPFASVRGRAATFVVKAGSTVLNNSSVLSNVWVSGATGFKIYQGTNPKSFAHGGTTLRPVHNKPYLNQEYATWPFRWVPDVQTPSTINYTPGSVDGFPSGWEAGGIGGHIGPMSSQSYNMLYDTSDASYTRGYNSGLAQLSVAIHLNDPATGYPRPKFGSYSGLGTASTNSVTFLTTFDSSGVQVMFAEFGHFADSAFAPALLTGELAFVEGMHCWSAKVSRRHAAYTRPQVTGRTRREFPFLYHWDESTLSRYDDWPHRDLLNFLYIADDGRHDKEYAKALEEQTHLWAHDFYVDFLPWTSTGDGTPANSFDQILWDGNKTGTSTTNFWALALTGWSDVNAYGAGDIGWRADSPWCTDFRGYVMWLAYARNGETYPKDVYDTFYGRNMIGRAVGPDTCVAYLAGSFNPPSVIAGTATQTWEDLWQNYFADQDPYPAPPIRPLTRTECPLTVEPNEGGKIEHKYVNVLALLHRAGFANHYSKSYEDAYTAVQECFGGGGTDWDATVGGRWVMEKLP